MFKKLFLLTYFVLVLALAGNALANFWDGGAGAGNPYWNVTVNWSTNSVPTSTDDVEAIKVGIDYGPTVANPTGAVAKNVYVGTWGWPGELTVTSSGSLTTAIDLVVGNGANDTGVVVNEGSIDVGANMDVGRLGDGLLNMNGGTIDVVGNLDIGSNTDATGHANFHGGTVTAGGLLVQGDGTGTADFTTGVLIFGGDQTGGGINWMASQGWWTAYGGDGTVMTDYGNINPGCTTVWGVSGMTLNGDINGDMCVDLNDLSIIVEQWLGMPGVPSADIAPDGGDGVVNFLDFALMAADYGYGCLGGEILPNGNFYLNTPYYTIEISPNPVRIQSLCWDLDGKYNYQHIIIPEYPGTQWASTLYAGVGNFTTDLAQAAENLSYTRCSGCTEVLLSNIAIIPNLKADWRFIFYPDYFKHEITWDAETDVTGLCNIGHQWITSHLTDGAGDEGGARTGDVPGFSDYAYINDEEMAFMMDFQETSTTLQANRYYIYFGMGILWQNLWGHGTESLTAGSHAGGQWICRAVKLQDINVSPPLFIGKFRVTGEYFKDFYFLKENGVYHLFYNVGIAGPEQDWSSPGNEDEFGHATSTDLNNWTIHDRILHTIPNTWEHTVVSAPSILKVGDQFKMTYTGFDTPANGYCERIGLAESDDLFNWTRYAGNPVYEGPSWSQWQPGVWADCRDADIIEYNGNFLMYTMVKHQNGDGAVAMAKSSDLINWADLGPAVTSPGRVMESPCVFERNGWYYMIVVCSDQVFKSADPEVNGWPEILFDFVPGPWVAYEVLYDADQDRWIIAAFRWTLYGNKIFFWDLIWDGDQPIIVYE